METVRFITLCMIILFAIGATIYKIKKSLDETSMSEELKRQILIDIIRPR